MDKKAWIVVTICTLLLAGQWYMMNEQRKEEAAKAATEQAAAPEAAATETQAATETPAAPAAETAAAPTTEAPAAEEISAEKPEIIATLTGKLPDGTAVARYDFRDIGGSVSGVTMLGKAINSTKPELHQDVVLNSAAQQGIGTLMFNLNGTPKFDTAKYSVLAEQTNDKQVTLVGRAGNLIIRKIYTLKPLQQGEDTIEGNAYVLDLKIDVQNTAATAQEAANWGLYAGAMGPLSTSDSYYNHYVRLEDNSFSKENAGSFRPWFGRAKDHELVTDAKDLEWVGTMNQYYATIVQPAKNCATNTYYAAPFKFNQPVTNAEVEGLEAAVGMPAFTLSPKTEGMQGGQQSFSYSIFMGPKLNLMLNDMTGEFRKLDRVMDYSFVTPISYAMNWLINKLYLLFGNWGWSIVAMTFVVRLLIWPLYRKSYYSMKRMSLLQPKIQELKDKYGNDNQKVQVEMMNLYREYGINPTAGCLPMMLQMPIFLAFFWMLQTAAEFRGAPWMGWVTDLSQMDTVATLPIMGHELPINILPIIMAFSMLFMMRMTPTPAGADNMQVKIMRWMPLMFFFFCYTYGSALALYWTTTNIISIIQTLIIRRMPMPELEKVTKKKGHKKSFFEKMMDAQQKALDEQQRQAGMRNVTKK